MGRVFAIVLLAGSLTCFAQTTAPQTTKVPDNVPARVNLDPAVPGVGASTPLHVLTQPSAPGETPVVVQEYRVATPLVPSGPPADAIAPAAPAENATKSTIATPVLRAVSYTAAAPAPGPSLSVADAAAQYRTNKPGMKSRVIDNNTLSVLDRNPSGLVTANQMTMPESDLTPEEEAALRHAKPEHAAGGDVLDPRDLAAVEAAVRHSERQDQGAQQEVAAAPPQPVAGAQYEQMSREAESHAEPVNSARAVQRTEDQTALPDPKPDRRERLPESSTGLPFVALLGFMALAGGVVSVMRSRA